VWADPTPRPLLSGYCVDSSNLADTFADVVIRIIVEFLGSVIGYYIILYFIIISHKIIMALWGKDEIHREPSTEDERKGVFCKLCSVYCF
jgi:hypothetical protein